MCSSRFCQGRILGWSCTCTGQQTFPSKSGSVIVSGRIKIKLKRRWYSGWRFLSAHRHWTNRVQAVSSRQCTDRVAVNHRARSVWLETTRMCKCKCANVLNKKAQSNLTGNQSLNQTRHHEVPENQNESLPYLGPTPIQEFIQLIKTQSMFNNTGFCDRLL